MGVHHGHHPVSAGARHRGRLRAALVITAVLLVVEAGAAFATGSLALLSDAGHVLTDAVGLGMALAAIGVAQRSGPGGRRTYGLYRLEILAALGNAVLLLAVTAYVVVEAVRRFSDPPEVASAPFLVVAVVGLAGNLVSLGLLRPGASESLNVRGAYLEVVFDAAGSVAVVAAAIVVATTGWDRADPLFGAAIAVAIVPRAVRLGRDALHVLLQVAPRGLDLHRLEADLRAVDGVIDVHDLHVWTLTSEMDVASVHLKVAPTVDAHRVLDTARDLLADRYRLAHATLQVEPDGHEGCAEVRW